MDNNQPSAKKIPLIFFVIFNLAILIGPLVLLPTFASIYFGLLVLPFIFLFVSPGVSAESGPIALLLLGIPVVLILIYLSLPFVGYRFWKKMRYGKAFVVMCIQLFICVSFIAVTFTGLQ